MAMGLLKKSWKSQRQDLLTRQTIEILNMIIEFVFDDVKILFELQKTCHLLRLLCAKYIHRYFDQSYYLSFDGCCKWTVSNYVHNTDMKAEFMCKYHEQVHHRTNVDFLKKVIFKMTLKEIILSKKFKDKCSMQINKVSQRTMSFFSCSDVVNEYYDS